MGHFVSSTREKETRDIRDSRGNKNKTSNSVNGYVRIASGVQASRQMCV